MFDDQHPSEFPNPYASPTTSSGTKEVTDDDLLSAFVGKNADFYLRKWQPVFNGGSGGFNWAAFILCGLWIGYRKMYKIAAIFYGVILIETILEEFIFVAVMGEAEAPPALSSVVSIVTAIIVGSFGNQWYLSHARRIIAEESAKGLPPQMLLEQVRRRGGTSWLSGIGVFIFYMVIVVATVIALELLLFE